MDQHFASSLPGFTADASLYRMSRSYRSTNIAGHANGASEPIGLAAVGDCGCGWLRGCARARCSCRCAGGDILPDRFAPCGFYCI
jgi:hypothetical protein